MAITLDGTTGITTPGLTNTGTETIVNLTTTGNTILGDASTDTLNVGNGGLVKDASGNVGIGTASPAVKLDTVGNIRSTFNSTLYLSATTPTTGGVSGKVTSSDNNLELIADSTSSSPTNLIFKTSASGTTAERMRLDASGNVLVGATGNAGTGAIVYANGTFAGTGYNTRTGIGGSFTGNSFNINWTGSVAELYIATTKVVANLSDYRFKKNIVSQTDAAISKVMNLHPVVYELADNGIYKGDGIVREGFIAHELAEIIPSAVEGAKDQVDEEGKDIPQGLKLDAIVSVLTKAIQEQQALITNLTARLEALEAK